MADGGTMTTAGWQNILDQLNSKSDNQFYFPKDGRTRLKLFWPSAEDEATGQFFTPTLRYFKGQSRTRYIVFGVILGSAQGDSDEQLRSQVKAIVINKTTLKGIITLLAEGYDLLGEEGHGITLVRTGQGLETDYNILPSQKPIKLDLEELEWPEDSIDELARKFEEQSRERDQNRPTEAPEQKVKNARKAQESTGEDW